MSPLEPIFQALQQGDFENAFAQLERLEREARTPRERAQLLLEIAEVYSLYGREGIQGGQECLRDAQRDDPGVVKDPFYQGLEAEFRALGLQQQVAQPVQASDPNTKDGETAAPIAEDPVTQRILELALEARFGPPRARLHAAIALIGLGQAEMAEITLEPALAEELPAHLRWRFWSWRGAALEDLARYREASLAYARGTELTLLPSDKAGMLMDKAAMLLELDEPHDALRTLEEAKRVFGETEPAMDQASRLYLEARAHLLLDNPSLAKERAEASRHLEMEAGEPSHGAALVHGQALAALGEWPQAIAAFGDAVRHANPNDRAYAMHEMGLAQMDAGLFEDSRLTLLRATSDPSYGFRAEVLADLSEVEYRLGRFDDAERAAREALALGAVVPASLTLANVAYEYYRLDDALLHYARVLEQAAPGGREWVIAHQMSADTLVQQGWKDPSRIAHHAKIALEHLDASDEWSVTLAEYIEKAGAMQKDAETKTLN